VDDHGPATSRRYRQSQLVGHLASSPRCARIVQNPGTLPVGGEGF